MDKPDLKVMPPAQIVSSPNDEGTRMGPDPKPAPPASMQPANPERRAPKKNCRHCQGRGYAGFLVNEDRRKIPVLCRCTNPK
jgi:hypothetical protein